MEQEQHQYLDELDVTPAAFIEKGEKRFSVRYRLSADEFLTFNRFIFENTAQLLKSKSRMRWMGICELLLSLVMLLVLVFTDKIEPLSVMLGAVMALAGAFSSLSGDDEQVRFLRALKPLLSDERKGRVDEAVRLLKLVSLLPALQESGLLTNLFGKL